MQKENLSGGDKSVRGGGLRNFGMGGQALMGGHIGQPWLIFFSLKLYRINWNLHTIGRSIIKLVHE